MADVIHRQLPDEGLGAQDAENPFLRAGLPGEVADECNHWRKPRCRLPGSRNHVVRAEHGLVGPVRWSIPTSVPTEPLDKVADAHLLRIVAGTRETGQGPTEEPVIDHTSTSRLKSRLLAVDVIAAGGTWLTLGALAMPTAPASRQWGAALAALVGTLVAMKLLRLYRSRLCVQRGQEIARVVISVAAAAVALELVRGDWRRSEVTTLIAAGSCVLASIALRGMFGHWLRSERAMGRHQRGLVMIGTNDDAMAISTMLNTQPELGYEVRGVIGRSRRFAEWGHLCNGEHLDDLPEIARQTNATGVLLVANALSASEVRDAM